MTADADPIRSSYEELPYESNPIFQSHPDVLATAAWLRGIDTAPLARARVLDLGCAAGGNLLPLGEAYPDGRFVGVDFSPRQIELGQRDASAVGLGNVELRAMSILDIGPELGVFDYIVVHGVYAWVPVEVREKILFVCAQNLADNGVVYISYDTLPGGLRRTAVREMLRYHLRDVKGAAERLAGARRFLSFLHDSVVDTGSSYADGLREWTARLAEMQDGELLHDHLADAAQALYFHQVNARAEAHGLQYFGEASRQSDVYDLPDELQRQLLRVAKGRGRLEQYLDFLRNRSFRRSMFCKRELALAPPSVERVAQLHASALVFPASRQVDVRSHKEEQFRGELDTVTTSHPLIKAMLVALAELQPRALAVGELWREVVELLGPRQTGPDGEAGPGMVPGALLQCWEANLLALHREPPRFAETPGARPCTTRLARLQAETRSSVPNLRHRAVVVGEFDRLVLTLLDGRRDREALLDELERAVADGVFDLTEEGRPVADATRVRALLAPPLEESLRRLAASALLLPEVIHG